MDSHSTLQRLKNLPDGAFHKVIGCVELDPAYLAQKVSRAEQSIELYRFADSTHRLAKLETCLAAAEAKYPHAHIPPPPDLGRLPIQNDEFFGRKDALAWLNRQFKAKKTTAALIHGGPGSGKTALLDQWLKKIEPKYRADHWLFAWSFYNQGQRDNASSADEFFQAALTFFGCDPLPAKADAYPDALARLFSDRPALLLLDGLEPLQDGGLVRDKGLDRFLRQVLRKAAPRCFIVLTSRQKLEKYPPALVTRDLERLGSDEGVKLLHAVGVSEKERAEEVAEVVEKLAGHPLSLSLLGKLLKRRYHGRLAHHARIVDYLRTAQPKPENRSEDPDNEQARHAAQVLRYYDEEYWDKLSRWERFTNWLLRRETREERLFLYLLALSDRPLTIHEAWAVLRTATRPEDYFYPLAAPVHQALEKARQRGELRSRSEEALARIQLLEIHTPLFERLVQAGLLLPSPLWKRGGRGDFHNAATAKSPPSPLLQRGGWDCHPLVRDYFAARFEAGHAAAFRAAHRCLYDFYRRQGEAHTKNMDKPQLADLEAFYRAIPHGCLAGAYQAALHEVYKQHLVRIENGKPIFYSVHQLGAQARDLAVLAGFFPRGWAQGPTDKLARGGQAFLLNQAAHLLMSQGRLTEARGPQERAVEMEVELQDWENAATAAGNLCNLQLVLGDLAAAVEAAQQGLDFARRIPGDAGLFLQMSNTARLATARHRQGDLRAAGTGFAEAEALKLRDNNRQLSSLPGVLYCAWWLAQVPSAGLDAADRAVVARVRERAAYGLEVSKTTALSIRDTALYHLLLARCAALLGEDGAAEGFDRAVAGIEQADSMQYAPEFYLARAEFLALTTPDAENQARIDADLESARALIERGGMRCFEVDYLLLCIKLDLVSRVGASFRAHQERRKPEMVGNEKMSPTLQDYHRATELITETGYHLQDGALWMLAARLAARRPEAFDETPETWLRRAREHIQAQNHRCLVPDWRAACEACGVELEAPVTAPPEAPRAEEAPVEEAAPAAGVTFSGTMAWDWPGASFS